MKKFIAFILIVGVLVGGYALLMKYGQVTDILAGKVVKVHRGDLDVPITASGRIEPASVAQLKSKASGEVIKIPHAIGEMVPKGAVIIELDRSDEQRNYDRAAADYERAKIALSRSEIAEEEAAKVGVPLAKAELDQAEARFAVMDLEHTRKATYKDRADNIQSKEEWMTVDARWKEARAIVAAAEAKVEQAKTAVKYAEKDVLTMKQNVAVAEKQRDESEQRLKETTVFAPWLGMIVRQSVRVGEIAQGGKASLTGGTVLLDLADVSNVYAVVNVDEADIGMVRQLAPESARSGVPATQPQVDAYGVPTTNAATLPEGVIDTTKEVEITVESFPNERFGGVIERIAPQSEISAAIATFRVWIRLTSPNKSELVHQLNTQAEAHFTAKSVRDALLVSYDAFQKNPNGDGFGVYVPIPTIKEGKKYEFRPCEFGRDNGSDVQVIKGLREGEEVYTVLPQMTRKEEEAAEKSKR